MSTRPKRAALYLRVSTESQTGRDGDAEGYSIPAQREAGARKAEELGAEVVAEFSDPGVTGRSDRRPGLQALLERIRSQGDIDMVIVWKLSRMSRSPLIDENLELEFLAHNVRLVSCTENIDGTPGGRLLRRILGTINAYEIDNLAQNVSSGMERKAKTGGTVARAPLGYINVRKFENGVEVRTVEVDPERAPLVQWAFKAYASGDYTLTRLHEEVTDRGLRTRATRKFSERPIARSVLAAMLSNRYYIGVVSHKGVEYPGRHQPLVSADLFERVQETLVGNRCGQKTQQHQHYLKGSIFCDRCGARMSLMFVNGQAGGLYPYFYCLGRHQGSNCKQPYLPMDRVEDEIRRFYQAQTIEPRLAERIRVRLRRQLREDRDNADAEAHIKRGQLEKLKRQRKKLLDAHYDDLIDPSLFAEEQRRINQEVRAAESAIAEADQEWEEIEASHDDLFGLVSSWGELFEQASDHVRRRINRVLWNRIEIGGDGQVRAEVAEAPDRERSRRRVAALLEDVSSTDTIEAARQLESQNPPLISSGVGSNIVTMVPPAGFEPATPGLGNRCSIP